MIEHNSLYGNYRQRRFSQIWKTADEFITDYSNIGIPQTITQVNATTLYYLLYSRYGNSVISSSDETRFKYNVFSIIWQYGPTWEKKLSIQATLRNLSEQDILKGSKLISNNAANPGVSPGTDADEELAYINSQNTSKSTRGKLEGYGILLNLLENDVTDELLCKFKKLFLTIVEPELPLLYEGDENDDN